ncbi:MAG TPA: hypothetical protein PKH65_06655 [Bacteroidia bacterium]|nr:hypothetical protein [Bacteroidia bacterium]HNT80348.1 hypothetical protein [Bacteroidia bacterium]
MNGPKVKPDLSQVFVSSEAKSKYPKLTTLFFLLLSSSITVLCVLFLYLISIHYTVHTSEIQIPKLFFTASVYTMMLSLLSEKSIDYFKNDRKTSLLASTLLTTLFSLLFIITTAFCFAHYIEHSISFQDQLQLYYLFVFTAFVGLHILGYVLHSVQLLNRLAKVFNDKVGTLLYFSDESILENLRLSKYFCHYVNVIWLIGFYLMVFTM